MSLDRRRPRAAADEEGAAGVGIGICNSGGSRRAMISSERELNNDESREENSSCPKNVADLLGIYL